MAKRCPGGGGGVVGAIQGLCHASAAIQTAGARSAGAVSGCLIVWLASEQSRRSAQCCSRAGPKSSELMNSCCGQDTEEQHFANALNGSLCSLLYHGLLNEGL